MNKHSHFLTFVIALTLGANAPATFAQGTAITYQGSLNDNGGPATGTYSFAFSLFGAASGGTAVAGPVITNVVLVTNGLFTVCIDFGASAFTGSSRWMPQVRRPCAGN
jgi:hypothetical protein